MGSFKVMVILCGLLLLGAGAIYAEDEAMPDGHINDGRVNYWDLAAPIAVYCNFDNPDINDPDYSVFESVSLWGINAEGSGYHVLTVTSDEIDEIGYTTSENIEIASEDGFTLNRATDGSLYVISPLDSEGKFYTFSWELGNQNC